MLPEVKNIFELPIEKPIALSTFSSDELWKSYKNKLGINNPTNRDQTYNKYNIQQPFINNNDVRQLQEEQEKTTRKNISNNRLLKMKNSVLKVDPQNRSKILRNRPVEHDEVNKPANYNKWDRKYWNSYLLQHNNVYDLPILVPSTYEIEPVDKSNKNKFFIYSII